MVDPVRLLEGEFYSYTRALYVLAEIHFHLSEWEHLLADIDDLWMNVMKTRPRSVAGRRILKDLEVMTVLVLQKSQVTPSGRHKLLKELYEGISSSEGLKKPIRSSLMDDSSLSPEDFAIFKKFLRLLSSGNGAEARGLMFEDGYMSTQASAVKTVKARFSFLSPLGVQVLQRFLDENQDEYGY
ncbi:hypothetical protein OESDEN_00649 [Oesophagostomum dentatum]|uniref:Uncharacterized protein n=1 Tax=Oesophagostomum dentatum TaxID=61180 RepID=A0A0B1TV80_OESDE|nr:hypothetical protein OESDEN_00649 [Oesophagostomum dentatum]